MGLNNVNAQIEKFNVKEAEENVEVCRITNNPTVRDWANYHNTQCWSPDGLYLVYTYFESNGKQYGTEEGAEIHLYNFQTNKDIFIGQGVFPIWANQNNRLFYTEKGSGKTGRTAIWYDVEKEVKTVLTKGVQRLKRNRLSRQLGIWFWSYWRC